MKKRYDRNFHLKTEEKCQDLLDTLQNDDHNAITKLTRLTSFGANLPVHTSFAFSDIIEDGQKIEASLINMSAFYGSVQCFRFLLNNGAKLDDKSLKSAIHGGNHEIIQAVEKHGIKVQEEDLLYAVFNHNSDVFDWIIEKYPKSLTEDVFRLCIRVDFVNGIIKGLEYHDTSSYLRFCENIALAKYITKEGEPFGFFDYAVIHNLIDFVPFMKDTIDKSFYRACSHGHIDIVKQLFGMEEVDVSSLNISDIPTEFLSISNPLSAACYRSHADVVKFLLSLPNINANLTTKGCYDK